MDLLNLSDDQAIDLASVIINDKTNNLKFDVNRCMKKDSNNYHSPLSALLYCFSMIDFFGSLYAGQGNRNSQTVRNARNWLLDMMNYSNDSTTIIWRAFRHKTSHISMPQTVFEYDHKLISWELSPKDGSNHLQIIPFNGDIHIGNTRQMLHFDYKFVIHIETFSEEIIASMETYLIKLKQKNPKLLDNFRKAIQDIYEIEIIP